MMKKRPSGSILLQCKDVICLTPIRVIRIDFYDTTQRRASAMSYEWWTSEEEEETPRREEDDEEEWW